MAHASHTFQLRAVQRGNCNCPSPKPSPAVHSSCVVCDPPPTQIFVREADSKKSEGKLTCHQRIQKEDFRRGFQMQFDDECIDASEVVPECFSLGFRADVHVVELSKHAVNLELELSHVS